jgi:hypothetical protein
MFDKSKTSNADTMVPYFLQKSISREAAIALLRDQPPGTVSH